MLLSMSQEHVCYVIKDRTDKFQDKEFPKPTSKFGMEIKKWLETESAPVGGLESSKTIAPGAGELKPGQRLMSEGGGGENKNLAKAS